MEPKDLTLFIVSVLGIFFTVRHWIREKNRPKVLAIIEDSDDDYKMLKMFCDFENTSLVRYRTADDLAVKFALNRPDAVIADYYLAGNVNGDKIIKLCDKFRIPSLLITGCSQDICDIPESRILRKSAESTYFDRLTMWVNRQFA